MNFFIDIKECKEGLNDRCDPNSACSNTIGGYECTCKSGFSGDGTICEGKFCGRADLRLCCPLSKIE